MAREPESVETVSCADCGEMVCYVAEKDAKSLPDVFCESCIEEGEEENEKAEP